jgi:hypothetical protein
MRAGAARRQARPERTGGRGPNERSASDRDVGAAARPRPRASCAPHRRQRRALLAVARLAVPLAAVVIGLVLAAQPSSRAAR